MKCRWFVALAIVGGLGIQACAQLPSDLAQLGGWTTLIDGEKGLDNWNRVGDANWRPEDGAIVAYRGKGGFLVSKSSYKDFQLRAEFWADPTTNSGIFIRLSNPKRIGADNSYQVKVSPMTKAGGQWNTLEITARGSQLTVALNGVQTASVQHAKFAQGPLALQYGAGAKNLEGGPIKWRRVQIKPLQESVAAASKAAPAGGGAARP
jgi:3-keto-disaccharide hydrolase